MAKDSNIKIPENLQDLNDSQLNAFKEIVSFFEYSPNNFYLLSGSAGTGKTYLIGKIAEYLTEIYNCKVLLCAPTNKAVKVLKDNLNNIDVDFGTIHSALGLKEDIDIDGNIIFRNQYEGQITITKYNFVILDESSMIDVNLFKEIIKNVQSSSIKLLFVGDKTQIPPVNYIDSIVFMPDVQKEFNIDEIELTKIVRQHQDNPIILFASEIKNNLNKKSVVSDLITDLRYSKSKHISVLTRDRKLFDALISDYFLSTNFENDANYCKIIAWTNNSVRQYNNLVRNIKYGNNPPQLVKGEKLIIDRPWVKSNKIIYSTNEEINVSSFSIKSYAIKSGKTTINMHYYDTVVCLEGSKIPEKHHIKILLDESKSEYDKHISKLKKEALSHPKGSDGAINGWRAYYNFINRFTAVKYSYAITCHKSQGSTYTHVIVIDYDINQNKNIIERNRIKYTAVTRPKENLYIII